MTWVTCPGCWHGHVKKVQLQCKEETFLKRQHSPEAASSQGGSLMTRDTKDQKWRRLFCAKDDFCSVAQLVQSWCICFWKHCCTKDNIGFLNNVMRQFDAKNDWATTLSRSNFLDGGLSHEAAASKCYCRETMKSQYAHPPSHTSIAVTISA